MIRSSFFADSTVLRTIHINVVRQYNRDCRSMFFNNNIAIRTTKLNCTTYNVMLILNQMFHCQVEYCDQLGFLAGMERARSARYKKGYSIKFIETFIAVYKGMKCNK